jgi:hypothetical protein
MIASEQRFCNAVGYIIVNEGWNVWTQLHLTPTKPKTAATDTNSARRLQSRCRICNAETIMVCSYCRDDPQLGESKAAFCCPTTERDCYARHMTTFTLKRN